MMGFVLNFEIICVLLFVSLSSGTRGLSKKWRVSQSEKLSLNI